MLLFYSDSTLLISIVCFLFQLTVLGMSLSAALIAALAIYFRRRRRRRPYRNITSFDREQDNAKTYRKTGRVHPLTLKSPGTGIYVEIYEH